MTPRKSDKEIFGLLKVISKFLKEIPELLKEIFTFLGGKIAEKWNVSVIDLWNNGQLNSVSGEQRALYMNDNIHPTRLGYRDFWLPVIRPELEALVNS